MHLGSLLTHSRNSSEVSVKDHISELSYSDLSKYILLCVSASVPRPPDLYITGFLIFVSFHSSTCVSNLAFRVNGKARTANELEWNRDSRVREVVWTLETRGWSARRYLRVIRRFCFSSGRSFARRLKHEDLHHIYNQLRWKSLHLLNRP